MKRVSEILRKKIIEELNEMDRKKPFNCGTMDLAIQYGMYPDFILDKYHLWDNDPDGWEGDLTNQL